MGYVQSKQVQHQTDRKLGLIRSEPDKSIVHHDFKIPDTFKVSNIVDLRTPKLPVLDQGSLGSCSANAFASAYQFDLIKQNSKKIFTPSRLFIYWNERSLRGTVNQDSGAYMADGMKAILTWGVCPESYWPYFVSQFRLKPSTLAYSEAKKHKAVIYKSVAVDLTQMKNCLSSGYPFVFGISVYESFFNVKSNGLIAKPDPTREKLLGGHAMVCLGFDETRKVFIVRNSWGPNWADHGNCYLPYDYLANLNFTSDCWTIEKVTSI